MSIPPGFMDVGKILDFDIIQAIWTKIEFFGIHHVRGSEHEAFMLTKGSVPFSGEKLLPFVLYPGCAMGPSVAVFPIDISLRNRLWKWDSRNRLIKRPSKCLVRCLVPISLAHIMTQLMRDDPGHAYIRNLTRESIHPNHPVQGHAIEIRGVCGTFDFH